jgi:hypothetical protein
VEKVDLELKDLQATLANIEDARPFEDLTVNILPCVVFFIDVLWSHRLRTLALHTHVLLRQ